VGNHLCHRVSDEFDRVFRQSRSLANPTTELAGHLSGQLADADYRRYHQYMLNPRERERFREAADQALNKFAADAIAAQGTAESQRHHLQFRWFGVLEAVLGAVAGAAVWTFILIFGSVAAHRAGIGLWIFLTLRAPCFVLAWLKTMKLPRTCSQQYFCTNVSVKSEPSDSVELLITSGSGISR
jgi:hypothetical protein